MFQINVFLWLASRRQAVTSKEAVALTVGESKTSRNLKGRSGFLGSAT
jgi:hypothetical protein